MKNNVVKGSLCCAGCVINVGFSYLMTNLAGLLCVPLMTKLGCALPRSRERPARYLSVDDRQCASAEH